MEYIGGTAMSEHKQRCTPLTLLRSMSILDPSGSHIVSFSLQNVMTGKFILPMSATSHSVTLIYSEAFLALVFP